MTERPRVLLTGAGGFVGRQVVAHLAGAVDLHCVARRPRTGPGDATWHAADLRDPAGCAALVETVRPSHLLHLAWITVHGEFWTSPENLRWRDAGLALAEAFAETGGARLVMAGSGAEYAPTAPSPLAEDRAPLMPQTPYGQAKHELRQAVAGIADKFGLSFAWARIFYPYGPYEDRRRLVPSVINAILHGTPAKCSSGRQIRDFMDVRELGAALAALIRSDVEGAINLGSGRRHAIAEVAETIGRLMGRPDLIALGALPDRPGEPAVQVPDLTRMRDELRFRPRIDIEQGLRDAITWWQESHDTFDLAEPGKTPQSK